MDLFNYYYDFDKNILPFDGKAFYFGKIFDSNMSEFYFNELLNNITWYNDEFLMFGKKIITSRKVAWYADDFLTYTYSKSTKLASAWTSNLLELKKIVELKTNETYNSCLLNLYHNGSESMGWHSDNEQELKPNGAICSLSFGATRKFSFKNKTTNEVISLNLENGSLLLMKDEIQQFWKHQLPKTKNQSLPRINLTFRTIQK